ncbi:DUF5753 domain-containing protein [Actinoplanes sp. NPDC023936]|uniref:DUF5753 domain-containing protein n=1 Tax=Actinoplanes sp. NPDC023936 TaxID=3154910 RepID=UPI0033D7826F
MTASTDPTVSRLALWRRLTTTRIRSGQDPKQVADALGWPLADLLLVEAVADGIADGRLLTLIDHYGLGEDRETVDLYRKVQPLTVRDTPLSREVRLLVEYEKVASSVRAFEPFVIPGLLQTRAYAEAVLTFYASPAELAPLVEARMARKEIFERDDAPEMHFLIDESALRRWAGATGPGPEIMREQLEHLRRIAGHPRVRVQVVPYAGGLHEGMKGPFVILGFTDPEHSELLYLEDAKGDVVRADAVEAEPYLERFGSLLVIAAPAGDLDAFLDRALAELAA